MGINGLALKLTDSLVVYSRINSPPNNGRFQHIYEMPNPLLNVNSFWREMKRFLIKNLDFLEILRESCPDDIDSFGKIFLTIVQEFEVKEWLDIRGNVGRMSYIAYIVICKAAVISNAFYLCNVEYLNRPHLY
jgi:hypothetical protein